MQDRPNRQEILQVVTDLLDQEVLPDLGGPLQYKVRVASNLLHILGRELDDHPARLARNRAGLLELLGSDAADENQTTDHETAVRHLNRRLQHRLGDNPDPQFEARAWQILMAACRDKLAVNRPGYDSHSDDDYHGNTNSTVGTDP